MSMMPLDESQPTAPSLPHFNVELAPPDLSPWREGNTGVPGFITREASAPGLHVALIALIHGNELAGAIVLDRLLRGGLWPRRGRLTFGFANLAAFDRFDPRQPTASRFVDEDMNRVWDPAVLDGPRRSNELDRARQIRPLVDTVDVLLDLHSMLWASEPLLLCGSTEKGRALALALRAPDLVVADHGHVSGRRLIDYGRFADPTVPQAAVLVEAGQHWEEPTVAMTLASVAGLLRHLEMADANPLLPPPSLAPRTSRFAEVTQVVTAATASFAFVRPFRGGEVVPRQGTLIATDGDVEIRTPHDDCLLVMPSLRPSRGHTAVRLARIVAR
jgi:predicted deacylase